MSGWYGEMPLTTGYLLQDGCCLEVSRYMYLRLLLRDVLSVLARNGAERRRSGAWRDGTVTAKLNATTTTRRPPMRTLPEVYCHHYLDRIHQDFGSARKDGETPASNGSGGRADMSLFMPAII